MTTVQNAEPKKPTVTEVKLGVVAVDPRDAKIIAAGLLYNKV